MKNAPAHIQVEILRMALRPILDAIDYTQGNCRPNEMVGAVCDPVLLANARKAIDGTKPDTSTIPPPTRRG